MLSSGVRGEDAEIAEITLRNGLHCAALVGEIMPRRVEKPIDADKTGD